MLLIWLVLMMKMMVLVLMMKMMVKVGAANKRITLLMVGLDNAGKTCTAKTIVGEVNILWLW